MKYKMVVSDFDGTLLRSDNTISARTMQTIKAYIAKGGIFTVSTGRMHSSIFKRLPELGLDKLNIPLMSYQGGYTVYLGTGEVIRKTKFDNSLIIEMVNFAKANDIYCQIYDFENLFIEKNSPTSEYYCKAVDVVPVAKGDLAEFVKATNPEIAKILMIVEKEKMQDAYALFDAAFGKRAHVVASSARLLEAVPLLAGKGNGLEHTAKNLGIDVCDVIAVGDQMNDITMIERAGLGAAVGNAKEEVKNIAKYITDTNDNDGVAKLIEKFCL